MVRFLWFFTDIELHMRPCKIEGIFLIWSSSSFHFTRSCVLGLSLKNGVPAMQLHQNMMWKKKFGRAQTNASFECKSITNCFSVWRYCHHYLRKVERTNLQVHPGYFSYPNSRVWKFFCAVHPLTFFHFIHAKLRQFCRYSFDVDAYVLLCFSLSKAWHRNQSAALY